MHLSHLFRRSVLMYASRPALAVSHDEAVSYAGLGAMADRMACRLRRDLGLKPGDRVAIVMTNCVEYVVCMLAAWHAGLCIVPINNRLHASEIDYILRDSASRVCLADTGVYDTLFPGATAIPGLQLIDINSDYRTEGRADSPWLARPPISRLNGNAPAWLFYTSGTTGRPKGVILTHDNLVSMALNFYADVQSVSEADALLHVAPMSHGSGLYSVPYLIKGALQIVPASGGFNAAEFCQIMDVYQNVSVFAAPTLVQRLTRHVQVNPTALAGLRCLIAGGAPFYIDDIKAAVRTLGPRVAQIYGQGETPMSIATQTARQIAHAVATEDDSFLASVGYAQTGIQITILDASGRPQQTGELGEIAVAGPTVMQGYWRNPKASEETLSGGVLHTGDIGLVDERGLLHLKDRSKDVIISGGINIYPREVEEALMQHPGITEVAVIAMPDPEWGESVLAFVVCKPDVALTPDELDAVCLEHIARFKRPKRYVFIDELPKSATGKVLKRELQRP